MKTNLLKQIGVLTAALTLAGTAVAEEARYVCGDSGKEQNVPFCEKQKDGSYVCKMSGTKMEKACCVTKEGSDSK